MRRSLAASLLALLAIAGGCGGDGGGASPGSPVLRVGHFPNLTHAQGLVGHGGTRAGKGWFEERLGPGVKVEWTTYDAGPSAMEAVLAGGLDLCYVGPSPAVNAHARSGGKEIRVLAGAMRGGAALVVAPKAGIAKPADFRGKRVATPQLGNTQDVSCRAWLSAQGFRVTTTGGDVRVRPTANADQIPLFQAGEIDAAWTVEPWVSRLETEAGGTIFLEEKDVVTTVLVASAKCAKERAALVARFAAAHRELTAWLREHPDEAKAAIRAELAAETRREFPAALLEKCWPRLRFDDAVARADFDAFVRAAVKAGTLPAAPDLSALVQESR